MIWRFLLLFRLFKYNANLHPILHLQKTFDVVFCPAHTFLAFFGELT